MDRREIFCCQCERDVTARLANGGEIYPHRQDLATLPFWKCDDCGNFVGCHHKTKNRTQPLGCIPTPAMKAVRKQIHAVLDPIWRQKLMKRGAVYAEMTERMGWKYHTGMTRSLEETSKALACAKAIADSAMLKAR